jgi:pyruvate/2-oxoglutarate dehydrogenase complex dihydrolipoamide dehydrogenase (E3) component
VIATGARAIQLPIPGIDDVEPLTNESIFSLTELPERLIVVGGGPIGSEMAQAFARLGSKVTQIEKKPHILSREDPDAAKIVQASLHRDGVQHLLGAETTGMLRRDNEKVVVVRQDEREFEVSADEILMGIGRAPNVDGLGLDDAGVVYDSRTGVQVNRRLQTTNPRIFAAGDVASRYKFTHAADFMARLVIGNALFWGRSKADNLTIPWATYTSPELAHVGMNPDEAARDGVQFDTYTQPMNEVDRAILEGETRGFVRIHTKRGSDRILGATVVAANAGDLIGEITLAMKNGIGLKKIASTIHPYPTHAEAIRKLGDQYNRTRLTPFRAKVVGNLLAWKR